MVQNDIDKKLEQIAEQHGYPGGATALKALLAGVSAAPASFDPLGWTDLVRVGVSDDARQDLESLRQRLGCGDGRNADGRSAGDGVRDPARSDCPSALRAELDRMGLDGFIVPRSDEHQGEAVPACSERLAWLTGFDGSAGVAVVLADRAALFVDGRYTLQGRQQTDPAWIDCRPIAEEKPEVWIARNAPNGARIGYDPWLHTVNGIARYEAALTAAGIVLVPAPANPVDAIWKARPPLPVSPIRLHPANLSGRDSADKRREVAESLVSARASSVFLSAPDSIAWLLNIRGGDIPNTPVVLAFAEVRDTGEMTVFTDTRKAPPDVIAALSSQTQIRSPDEIGVRLDELAASGSRVLLDPDQEPVWFDHRLRAGGATVVHGRDPCVLPKAQKTAAELAGARNAHLRDGVALTRFLAWIDNMMTGNGRAADPVSGQLSELSAAQRLSSLRRELDGFAGPSFETISGVGPNGAIVHYRVTPETDRPLVPGTLYLVDSGGQFHDGTTDVTRTVALGVPDDAMRRHYTLVLKGHLALSALRFPPGTTGTQIDIIARHALWLAGLDYDHGTGHGIGSFLSVHEGPQRISKSGGGVPLLPGMIISNEPGLYIEGAYGIRIENLIVVREPETGPETEAGRRKMHCFETLTLAPYDRRLIDVGRLSAQECEQVDRYHARVREALTPLLEAPGDRQWLEAATAPLAVGEA